MSRLNCGLRHLGPLLVVGLALGTYQTALATRASRPLPDGGTTTCYGELKEGDPVMMFGRARWIRNQDYCIIKEGDYLFHKYDFSVENQIVPPPESWTFSLCQSPQGAEEGRFDAVMMLYYDEDEPNNPDPFSLLDTCKNLYAYDDDSCYPYPEITKGLPNGRYELVVTHYLPWFPWRKSRVGEYRLDVTYPPLESFNPPNCAGPPGSPPTPPPTPTPWFSKSTTGHQYHGTWPVDYANHQSSVSTWYYLRDPNWLVAYYQSFGGSVRPAAVGSCAPKTWLRDTTWYKDQLRTLTISGWSPGPHWCGRGSHCASWRSWDNYVLLRNSAEGHFESTTKFRGSCIPPLGLPYLTLSLDLTHP